jgi:MATE family multidrug resistance protein
MALTKHPEGSMRELWSIALPLMLSSFSVVCMLFVDRLLLARYSTQALNAVVTSATTGWALWLGWMVMVSIAEVFVAQYNGSNQKKKIGEPVWQMIWLSCLSFAFFIPLALWGGSLFFGSSPERAMEREYFSWMMCFGPTCAIYSALSTFFIGQGRPAIITGLALVSNLINALLDMVLIFGVEGLVPSYGIKGAAIATCSSTVFQMAVLAFVFYLKRTV